MSWRDVARLTFLSHARSPWALALLFVTLVPLAVLGVMTLVGMATGAEGFQMIRAFEANELALPGLAGGVGAIVAAILLARVLLSFRGAWLLEPEGARQRVPGYFAGTVAAVAAGLLPWAAASAAMGMTLGPALATLKYATLGYVASLLLAAAWIAVLVLVCASVEPVEGRWAAAFFAWGLLAVVLPGASLVALAFGEPSDVGFGYAQPAWAFPLELLSPWSVHEALLSSAGMGTPWWYVSYENALPVLFNPFALGLVLVLWAAVPLALATRLQETRDGGLPLAPEVAP